MFPSNQSIDQEKSKQQGGTTDPHPFYHNFTASEYPKSSNIHVIGTDFKMVTQFARILIFETYLINILHISMYS